MLDCYDSDRAWHYILDGATFFSPLFAIDGEVEKEMNQLLQGHGKFITSVTTRSTFRFYGRAELCDEVQCKHPAELLNPTAQLGLLTVLNSDMKKARRRRKNIKRWREEEDDDC